MDSVRLGRALGLGARQAVKTLVTAVDAATAEKPLDARSAAQAGTDRTRPGTPGDMPGRSAASDAAAGATYTATGQVEQGRGAKRGLGVEARRFGAAVWQPVARLSGVLWLEVAGVFFGLFALAALGYLWQLRGGWNASTDSRRSAVGALIMLLLFGYFCVSSFVRARRRERQR